MQAGRDFDLRGPLPAHQADLLSDLELPTLVGAMAQGDPLIADVAARALLVSLPDAGAIVYRQRVLSDCLAQPEVVRELYALAGDALAAEKQVFRSLARDSPSAIASRSAQVLRLLADHLDALRHTADRHAAAFASPGFDRFFATISQELDDDYLALVRRRLDQLRFAQGPTFSARLGSGNHGVDYTLLDTAAPGWLARLGFDRGGYSFTIPERDFNGFKALGELQDRGLNVVANALAQATDHVMSFFTMLRVELAFYVGCLNLEAALRERGAPTCLPGPRAATDGGGDLPALSATGIYDPCLALTLDGPVVGNDLRADGRSLVIITGANQGGKSTLLRAVGVAALMSQAGMFAPARELTFTPVTGLFTHFKREEDDTMRSGKLDEELARMSIVADRISPGAMLLCNESFASTNEREGSQIAREVVRAMVDAQVRVLYVTHQFDLADGFHAAARADALFLRAGRDDTGRRTYAIEEAPPLPTSYGADSYRAVFGSELPCSESSC